VHFVARKCVVLLADFCVVYFTIYIPVAFLYSVIKSLKDFKFEPNELVGKLDIDRSKLYDVDYTIPISELDTALRLSAQITNREDIGLYQGAQVDIQQMGVLAYIMLNSKDFETAFNNYKQYNLMICSGISYDIHLQDHDLKINFTPALAERSKNRILMDCLLSSFIRLTEQLTGTNLHIKAVCYSSSPPIQYQPYIEFFGQTPTFNASETSLLLDAAILKAPIMFSNPSVYMMFKRYLDEKINSLVQLKEFTFKTEEYLYQNIRGNCPSIKDVSHHLFISTRTLQSKLKDENTTYQTILNDVRKSLSITYLKDNSMSITDIAYILGFSEPSTFYSTFKKWTGTMPHKYRLANMNHSK